METVAIRVPAVAALFDAWSPEPLQRRPLNDEARERIVDAWSEAAKAAKKRKRSAPERLRLALPEEERQEGLEGSIVTALRHDMETMKVDARHHWFRRSLAPRETRIGLFIFVLALLVGGLIDYANDDSGVETVLGQTFVVLAWVALWNPAYRVMTAASFRLGRHSFVELAAAEIEVVWD